jgi:uncharacterized protein (TIGR03437 family)
MKCISAFLLCAAATFAQDTPVGFITGQAARLVIGQSTFTSQDSNSSDTILGAASGLAFAGDTLFVADSNRVGATPSNHRVLIYRNISGMLPSPAAQLDYDRKCPVCVGQASVVLGQPDFTTTTENVLATQTTLRLPTAVASDGVHLVVADTNHNRILIWNRIPATNDAPADVVLGQTTFTTSTVPGNTPNAKSMRGPQGVWIQNGKLYVADTQNNRVLIFNSIPTSNGAAADVVLGQPNMTTFVQPDLTQQSTDVTAQLLLNPVAVSSDGVHLFVTDLGYNRVLIWNSIPTTNQQAADVVIGQPDMTTSVANYGYKTDPNDTTSPKIETPVLCTTSNGTDTNGNATYPSSCNSTLSFPRFALAAGNRLFIADGGNDRVLVYENIPTTNAAAADYVIGQIGGSVNQASDAADSLRTPMSLAWDGTNLYVSDAYNRRITVYSVGATTIPYTGVRNAASLDIVARGTVTIGGTIQAGDSVTINIGGTSSTDSNGTVTITGGADYKHTITSDDTIDTIIQALATLINAANSNEGDTNVYATPDLDTAQVLLTSRLSGEDGNSITVNITVTKVSSASAAAITATASGSTLSGGGDAAKIAPGSLVSILGGNLSFTTQSADLTKNPLPTTVGGTQVYFNGIRAPLVFVSPDKVTAQIPWELADTTSINAFVRSANSDGTVVVTTPVAVSIVDANPGIYAQPDTNPSVGLVYHGSSSATGIVSVDGTVTANDTATVAIEDRSYTYTVQSGDSLDSIRDALVSLINHDPKVTAEASGVFDRIVLKARVQGPEGDGITYGASASSTATVIMTAIGSSLCCANVEGSQVTPDNPAQPGETIFVLATGLGLPTLNDANKSLIQTGYQWPKDGPLTSPASSVNATAGGKTADVISASLVPGQVGMYKVVLHLNPDLTTDQLAQLTIAQDVYVSNIVVMPIVAASSTDSTATASIVQSSATALAQAATPQIAANGLTNAASYAGGSVSPGEITVLFGATTGPATLQTGSSTGVRVLFDGIAGTLIYAGPGQTAAVVPYGVAGKSVTQVQYEYQGVVSNTISMPVKATTPGVFTVDSSGNGAAAVLDSANRVISKDNPARRGDVLQLFATGGGATAAQVTDGQSSGLSLLVAPVTATIGGIDCPISYAGAAPGLVAGAVQINLQVPAGVPSGEQALVITIGGVSSQSGVTVLVQ